MHNISKQICLALFLALASSCSKKVVECDFVDNVPDILVVSVTDKGSVCFTAGKSIRIEAPVDTAAIYLWSPGGETSSSITVIAANTYSVTMTTPMDTVVYEKEVVWSCGFFAPNSFPPNGDSHNDDFGLVGSGIGCFYMEIYNLEGVVVYSTSDINEPWQGKRDNKGYTLPIGLYPYYMEFYTEGMTKHVFEGRVYLIL